MANLNRNKSEFPMNFGNIILIYPNDTPTMIFTAPSSCKNMRFENYETFKNLGSIHKINYIMRENGLRSCMVSLRPYSEPFIITYENNGTVYKTDPILLIYDNNEAICRIGYLLDMQPELFCKSKPNIFAFGEIFNIFIKMMGINDRILDSHELNNAYHVFDSHFENNDIPFNYKTCCERIWGYVVTMGNIGYVFSKGLCTVFQGTEYITEVKKCGDFTFRLSNTFTDHVILVYYHQDKRISHQIDLSEHGTNKISISNHGYSHIIHTYIKYHKNIISPHKQRWMFLEDLDVSCINGYDNIHKYHNHETFLAMDSNDIHQKFTNMIQKCLDNFDHDGKTLSEMSIEDIIKIADDDNIGSYIYSEILFNKHDPYE